MTMYHRGKRRSEYRKHAFATGVAISQSGVVGKTQIRAAPTSGSILIKSVRTLVIFPALATGNYATGWIGYGRYANTNPTPSIEESEVFGVKNWVLGHDQDFVMDLPLKGITLTKDETWFIIAAKTFNSSNFSIAAAATLLYAVHEVPA